MQYAGIVDGIKAYFAQMNHPDDKERAPLNPVKNRSIELPNPPSTYEEGVQERNEKFDTSGLDKMIRTLDDLRTYGVLKETDILPNILDTLRSLAAPGR